MELLGSSTMMGFLARAKVGCPALLQRKAPKGPLFSMCEWELLVSSNDDGNAASQFRGGAWLAYSLHATDSGFYGVVAYLPRQGCDRTSGGTDASIKICFEFWSFGLVQHLLVEGFGDWCCFGWAVSEGRTHVQGPLCLQGHGSFCGRARAMVATLQRREEAHGQLSRSTMEQTTGENTFDLTSINKEGLTSQEAQELLKQFGPNKLEEKPENQLLKFLGFMWNPLSWVMEFAAIMAIALANGNHKPPDWQDFVGIVALLFVNSTISFWEENNASNAAAALMSRLALKAKVRRDGAWGDQSADSLVPGDIVSIKLGDIIPADVMLLEGDPVQIDQSALTGESLSVTKKSGDKVLSGSICKQGEIEAVVSATGVRTFLGKAAHLVHSTHQVGHFQKVFSLLT
ncbi:hypothetical protein L7F22_017087 [Adiantum nelumboides]|nr:hypothetical protein [Adiantum nelumboides]